MGRSASARAKELFAEDVVMNQYEELFAELEKLVAWPRLQNQEEDVQGLVCLDPVQAFQAYPSHPSRTCVEESQFPNRYVA